MIDVDVHCFQFMMIYRNWAVSVKIDMKRENQKRENIMIKKYVVLILMVLLVLDSTVCFADRLSYRNSFNGAPTEPEGTTINEYMTGNFKKAGEANPGDSLLWFYSKMDATTDTGTHYWFTDNKKYVFKGRTGDKTFEIEFTYEEDKDSSMKKFEREAGIKNKSKVQKLNMFFEKDSLYELKEINFLTWTHGVRCPEDAKKVFLKMLELKGNQLIYQIIIPDCVTKDKNVVIE